MTDRMLPDMIRQICHDHDITYQSFSDDWAMRLEKNHDAKWIIGYTFDINTAASAYVANDKVACYQVLSDAKLPAIEHYLVRSRTANRFIVPQKELARVVAKPLAASSGIGVMPFDSVTEARAYVMNQPTGDWALSPRYDIARELRYFVLDSDILLAYEKTQPSDNHGLPMFNLSRGAIATVIEPSTVLSRMACNATRAIGLRACAVDIAQLHDGSYTIVEINQGFGLGRFAHQSQEHHAITYVLYEKIIDAMMQ